MKFDEMPPIENYLQMPDDLRGDIELDIGISFPRKAAYSNDFLRFLEDRICTDRNIDVQWWVRLREEFKERAHRITEDAFEPITPHKIWQAEAAFEAERNRELLERRFREHVGHGGTLEDWDPLKALGVLPFELWLKQLLQGDEYHRSSATKSHRESPLLTRRVAHLIVYGDLTASGKTAGG